MFSLSTRTTNDIFNELISFDKYIRDKDNNYWCSSNYPKFSENNSFFNFEWSSQDTLVINVPGYAKEDITLEAKKSKIVLTIKEDKEETYLSYPYDSEKYMIKEAKYLNGQLIISFEENKEDSKLIDIK